MRMFVRTYRASRVLLAACVCTAVCFLLYTDLSADVPRDDRGPRPVRLDRYRLQWSGGSWFSQVFTCIETRESSDGLKARQKPDVFVPLWHCFDMKQFQTISDLIKCRQNMFMIIWSRLVLCLLVGFCED